MSRASYAWADKYIDSNHSIESVLCVVPPWWWISSNSSGSGNSTRSLPSSPFASALLDAPHSGVQHQQLASFFKSRDSSFEIHPAVEYFAETVDDSSGDDDSVSLSFTSSKITALPLDPSPGPPPIVHGWASIVDVTQWIGYLRCKTALKSEV